MKIFISYARVDKAFCTQVAEVLDIHEVWYDQRLRVGANWWKQILKRLDWCEVFIYLLSPDSVVSEYCRREFEVVSKLNKIIIPILIDEHANIPKPIEHIQYADFTEGITTDVVKQLLNTLYEYEMEKIRRPQLQPQTSVGQLAPDDVLPNDLGREPVTLIGKAADAMERERFDQAVFLIKNVREQNIRLPHIDLDRLLEEAETALNEQARLKEIDLEYKTIAELIRRQRTRSVGCQALQSFLRSNPTYDPKGLSKLCNIPTPPSNPSAQPTLPPTPIDVVKETVQKVPAPTKKRTMPLLEWLPVSAGTTFGIHTEAFEMARFPVTNAQFEYFIRDPKGYANPQWWNFSPFARDWFRKHPQPRRSHFRNDKRLPRDSVVWYEAMAYTNWLSYRLNMHITLPTQAQWRRAASGDDNRLYTWGDTFNRNFANTREARIRMTTLVTRYKEGRSPFGIYDMIGNVWEWCLDSKEDGDNVKNPDVTIREDRAVLGGSWNTTYHRANSQFEFHLKPDYSYNTIGFRLVHLLI